MKINPKAPWYVDLTASSENSPKIRFCAACWVAWDVDGATHCFDCLRPLTHPSHIPFGTRTAIRQIRCPKCDLTLTEAQISRLAHVTTTPPHAWVCSKCGTFTKTKTTSYVTKSKL